MAEPTTPTQHPASAPTAADEIPYSVLARKLGFTPDQLRALQDHDKYSRVFYQPHTITVLVLLFGAMAWYAWTGDDASTAYRVKQCDRRLAPPSPHVSPSPRGCSSEA